MCAPIGDGAAAAILVSEEKIRQLTAKPLWVGAVSSPRVRSTREPSTVRRPRVARAYEMAGMTARDIALTEVHDATAPAELMLYEEMGSLREARADA